MIKGNPDGSVQDEIVLSGSYAKVTPRNRMIAPVADPVKMTIPTYDGSGQAVEPHVICIPWGFGPAGNKYKYWMVMAPYPNSNPLVENASILCSNSPDGPFVVPLGLTNPIVTPPGSVYYYDPYLVHEYKASTYERLAVYYTNSSDNKNYRTTSADGVTWTAPVLVNAYRWEDVSVAGAMSAPSVIYLGNDTWEAFSMYGAGSRYDLGSIARFTSTDGINFYQQVGTTKTNIIGLPQGELNIHKDALGYHIIGQAYPFPNDKVNRGTDLFYGYSPTGDEFVFDRIPVLSKLLGSFYENWVYRGTILPIGNGIYRVYFSAMDASGVWSIGYVDCLIQSANLPSRSKHIVRNIWYKNQLRTTTELTDSTFLTEIWSYKNKVIHVFNSLGQPLQIRLVQAPPQAVGGTWDIDGGTAQTKLLTAGTTQTTLTSATFAALGLVTNGFPVQIRAQASTTPTAGDFTVVIEAWD